MAVVADFPFIIFANLNQFLVVDIGISQLRKCHHTGVHGSRGPVFFRVFPAICF
ncbi:hypothetical protein D3C73_827020 [compost metagenome]